MSEIKAEKSDNKAFEIYDLRRELMNIDYNLRLVEKNCNTLNINLKKSEIVQKEIEGLDDKCRIYDRCGRIFVLSDKKEVVVKIVDNKKKMINELDSQNDKKKYLQQNLEEQKKSYTEAIKTTQK